MRKKIIWSVVVVVLVVGGYFLYPIVHLAMGAKRQGLLENVDPEKYAASATNNLNAIYTGLKIYHDSEGHFPKSSEWMTDLLPRIQTANMSDADAKLKLTDPAVANKPDAYGYAMNDAVSEKYIDDVKDKTTPLVFVSSDLSKNAHGDPAKLAPNPPRGHNLAITVEGKIVKLAP